MKYLSKLEPNRFYHIFNHAVGNENLFRCDANFEYFLLGYEKYISPICKTISYCLMPNHFHFFVEVKDEKTLCELAKVDYSEDFNFHKFLMQRWSNFLNSYAKSYNKYYSRRGALFIDFTKRVEIKDNASITSIILYIHLNAVKHGFCEEPSEWIYSSYNDIITDSKGLELERNFVINWFGDLPKFIKFHRQTYKVY